MSGEVLFDVMNCDGFGKPAMKLLLIALADRADETGVCWPSRDDLALRTGLSQSAITRTARALESGQWVQRKQRRDTSTLYRLNVVKISRCAAQCKAERRLRRAGGEWEKFPEEIAQPVENNGDGQCDPTSGQCDPTSGQSDHLTPQEPLKKHSRRRASRPDRRPVATGAKPQDGAKPQTGAKPQGGESYALKRRAFGALADVPSRLVGSRREFCGPDGQWHVRPSDPEDAKLFEAWCLQGTVALDRRVS